MSGAKPTLGRGLSREVCWPHVIDRARASQVSRLIDSFLITFFDFPFSKRGLENNLILRGFCVRS